MYSPVKWDKVTLDDVSFYRFPPQLKKNNYINLEQGRLDHFQSRPSNSIFSSMDQSLSCKISDLIENHNVIMLEIVKNLKSNYCQKTINYLDARLIDHYIRQLLDDVVSFINHLFQRKGHTKLDPLIDVKENNSVITVNFDVLTKLDDPKGVIPDILYRNYLRFKLLRRDNLTLVIKSFGWAKRPKMESPPSKVVNANFKQEELFNQMTNRNEPEQLSQLNKKCKKNEDCPYYGANRNYPNNFGGCDQNTGFCQMPIGVEHLNYLLPKNPRRAICGNCKLGDTDQCCQKQLVRSFYPKLASPDYRFTGDQPIREANRSILATRGLLP